MEKQAINRMPKEKISRLMVFGIDPYEIEAELRTKYHFFDDPDFEIDFSIDTEGNCKIDKSHKTVLLNGTNTVRVFIADPGERCLRIEGPKNDIRFVLVLIGIPYLRLETFDRTIFQSM